MSDLIQDLSVAGQELRQVSDQLLNALQSTQLHDGPGLLSNGLWDRISWQVLQSGRQVEGRQHPDGKFQRICIKVFLQTSTRARYSFSKKKLKLVSMCHRTLIQVLLLRWRIYRYVMQLFDNYSHAWRPMHSCPQEDNFPCIVPDVHSHVNICPQRHGRAYPLQRLVASLIVPTSLFTVSAFLWE